MSALDPAYILAGLEGLTAHVRQLEDDLRRSRQDATLLETILTIVVRHSGDRIEWTKEEIQPAKDETRTLMLGALDCFLSETTSSPAVR